MRPVALLLVLATAFVVGGDAKKAQAPPGDPFARCVKILNFGQLNEDYKPAKQDAVAALGLLGDERAVSVLADHLKNESNANLRLQIVRALGWLKSPKAAPALETALEDGDFFVRSKASMALKDITGKDYPFKVGAKRVLPDSAEAAEELARLARVVPPQGAEQSFLEPGRTYHFTLDRQKAALTGKVLDAAENDWVKVEVQEGDKSVTSWVHLTKVAVVSLAPEEK